MAMTTRTRLQLLSSHITPKQEEAVPPQQAEAVPPPADAQSRLRDTIALRSAVRSKGRQQVRQRIFAIFQNHPELLPRSGEEVSKSEHRALCMNALRHSSTVDDLRALSLMEEDPVLYYELAAAMHCVDLSLAIKSGVQFTLWGGSILNLGSAKHYSKYRDAIANVSLPGCFAMTELGHGSDVSSIATEATYDAATEEFIVHTPTPAATKWWIGNAAEDGQAATVFCQLVVDGERHGVHAIIVPLRDAAGTVLPGVSIRDCGLKVGLNGVDNGAIVFNRVRVPRANLLDKFAAVSADGVYSSPIANPTKRFALMMGALTGGRVGLAAGSAAVLQLGTTIAVRYATRRRQFAPAAATVAYKAVESVEEVRTEASVAAATAARLPQETLILDYPAHQRKLIPLVAASYAHQFAVDHLVDRYAAMKADPADEAARAAVHALSSGLKPAITETTGRALDICREACGGHGYAAVNRLGELRADHDIWKTFEGDNTVLLQQLAAELLKRYGKQVAHDGYVRTAAGQLLQQPPVATGENICDVKFLLAALRYREARLTASAALRLRRKTAKQPQFAAWNECCPQLLKLATAHTNVVVMTQFVARAMAAQLDDPPTGRRLHRLCALYGLSRIADHMGSFVAAGILSHRRMPGAGVTGVEVERAISRLCAELRPDAELLVAGFDLPDHILRAPIGLATAADWSDRYMAAVGFDDKDLQEWASHR